jgi:disulfide bond formation protein DsbB
MTVRQVELFVALLTVAAMAGFVLVVGSWLLRRRVRAASDLLEAISPVALWLAWIVATTMTLGSLYFSEVADFVPCTLCWYQRICVYPLSVVLLIAALRRDGLVAWYAVPMMSIGAGIAAYHYTIEWYPDLEAGSCSATGPECSARWFLELGFVSLSFMVLVGCALMLSLLLLTPVANEEEVP